MKRIIGLLAAALAMTVAFATAQETTTGTIFGRVVDEQDALVPGATVTITSDQGTKEVVTDERGRFNMPYLTPGTYMVRVELAGFAPVSYDNVQVRLGQRTELVVTLRVGGVQEVVTVTETSPVVDVTSTTIGGTVDSTLLEKIPVGRQLADTLYVVPGVSSGGLTGTSNPSIGGGAGLDNQYHIDGVNVSDNGFGSLGVYSRSYRSMGQGVTYEFIDEVEVKTGGYEAEYGQSTGGVVNVITKSGTNNYRGAVFGYTQTNALEAERNNFDDWENGRATIIAEPRNDVGFSVGGPIIQNKAFFFGALHPQWNTRIFRAPNDPVNFPLASLGEVDRTRRFISYAAKGTYQVTPDHRIDASFFGDPTVSPTAPQTDTGADMLRQNTTSFSRLEFGGNQQAVRYQGVLSPNWLLEGSWSRAAATFTEFPSEDTWSTTDQTVTPNIRTGGIGFYENTESANLQYSVKSTNFVGSHQIRYGVHFEDISYDALQNYTGPPITLSDGQTLVTGVRRNILPDPVYGQIYRAARGNLQNVRSTTQNYLAFFAQDKFDVGNRLTFNVGLRYEQQHLQGNLTEFTWDNNWAPRLGVVFDPAGNGRSKIYANWGRFFAKVPNDLAARAMAADAGISRADYFDEAMTQPVPEGVLAGGQTRHLILAGLGASDFDPNSKTSYLDEAIVGYEFEPVPELNLGVRYVWRDLGRVLEDVGTASITLYLTNPEELSSVEYFITNITPDVPTVNNQGSFEQPQRNYQAVEFTADKRISDNWGIFASYRWSRLYGNFEGFFRSDNGQSDPGITSLFDFPTNDPTYVQYADQFGYSGDIRYQGSLGAGRLPNDREHQVKAYSTYTFDNGLGLGVGLLLSSGTPLTALAANPVYDNAGEIPLGPRGSGIETVADGFRTRAPFQYGLDLHADYRLAFGDTAGVTLIADVFNVFNNQPALRMRQYTELNLGVVDPDFGRVEEYANPFRARIGVRFDF